MKNRKVRFMCDNLGVVQAVNGQSVNSHPVVCLLRQLVLRCLELNMHFSAVHVPSVCNGIVLILGGKVLRAGSKGRS